MLMVVLTSLEKNRKELKNVFAKELVDSDCVIAITGKPFNRIKI